MKNINLFIIIFASICVICSIDLLAKENIKTINFIVTVPSSIDADLVNVTIPALKYNKKIVTTWTVDDSYSIYNQIFCVVNKKWVDDELMTYWDSNDNRTFFYHLNGEKTTGYIPQRPLEYTDGCGVYHRFAASVACWPWQLAEYDQDVSKYSPWVSSKEIRMMQDFGYTFCYHDISSDTAPTSQENFNEALSAAADSFQSKTDRTPKIMIEPNGNHDYVKYALNNDLIEASVAQNIDRYVYPFKENESLEKDSGCIIRYFGATPDEMINHLSNDLTLKEGDRNWHLNGSHRQSVNGVSTFFYKLDSLYGASGKDCVWVPSVDEYIEYSYMRNHTIISKAVIGNRISFTLQVAVKDRFWFQSLSLLVSGISDTSKVTVFSSDNVHGLSYGLSENKLLVNLDFNDYLPEHAEKYTSIFENIKTVEAYEDALYFVSLLKKELQEPYLNRMNILLSTPVASELTINDGKKETGNRTVSISFKANESAAYYRISESPDFKSVSWKPLETKTTIQLSPDFGIKTVYLQLKNARLESEVLSDQIELVNKDYKVVVGFNGSSYNDNITEIVNEEMLNNVSLNYHDTYSAIQLYDVWGNPTMKLAKNKSDICNALCKYGISERVSRNISSYNPTFTTDLGVYPNLFYSYPYFFGADSALTPETRRLIVGFINVPNGIYDIRILGSQNRKTNPSDYLQYRYQANDSEIIIPDSDIFNNNQNHFIELKNVTVLDSTLLICSWREPFGVRWGYYAPMNLIEIKKSTFSHIEPYGDVNKPDIKIISSFGKLIIEKNDTLPFCIYSIEGIFMKEILPENFRTEIILPPGIYIVQGKKGIVF